MNLTIRAKLLLLFALAAVPMLVVGAAGYYNSVRSVESVVEQRAANLAQEVAGELITFFEDRSSEVRLLARNQPVQELYARSVNTTVRPDEVDPGMERFFSDFFAGPREVYARTVYLDLEGKPILGFGRDRGTVLAAEQYSFSFDEPGSPGWSSRPTKAEMACSPPAISIRPMDRFCGSDNGCGISIRARLRAFSWPICRWIASSVTLS